MSPEAVSDSPTAAVLVVGDEILSGKIREANVFELARVLRSLGILLGRALIIPDDVRIIESEVRALKGAYDHLFTSGGIGPTHDDLTIAGIARALDVPVVRDPELESLIRTHYGASLHENHLALANVPRGSRKLTIARSPWPLTVIDNVYMLPGVPEIFRMKLEILKEHLGTGGAAFVSRAVFTKMDEALLKPLLDQVVARHPRVAVGSYPRWKDPAYETKITFDGKDRDAVELALADFVKLLPEGEPQWTE